MPSASTPSMQSLLSQSESNAFQSFLSSIDYTDSDAIPADEWAAFSASSASIDPPYSDQGILIDSVQNLEGRQALTKATKDLISLDTNGNWDDPNDSSMMNHSPVIHPNFDDHEYDQQGHRYQPESQELNSYPSRHDSFPFLHTTSHQKQPTQLRHNPVLPLTTGSPEPHSPYGFSQQQLHLPQQKQRGRGQDTSPGTKHKRLHTLPSRPSSNPPHKRQRLSPNESPPTSAPATNSAGVSSPGHSSSNPQSGPPQQQILKQNLLSPSQKKANHIQSEQKRRANIRRGYAALCETVPALREAIKEEEEAERIAATNTTAVVNGAGVKANGAGKKRSKKGAGKDVDDKDKDKTDGRAGPRSENTVLAKTIEHIQHLLTERSSLLTRLERARAALPPGHPVLTTLNPDPPWEREWKGGEGKLNFEDGDGDEEGDGGSGDEEDG